MTSWTRPTVSPPGPLDDLTDRHHQGFLVVTDFGSFGLEKGDLHRGIEGQVPVPGFGADFIAGSSFSLYFESSLAGNLWKR